MIPKGGYPIDWIDCHEEDLEKQEFICTICHSVYREPVHADNGREGRNDGGESDDEEGEEPCGHLFCNVCIRQWLQTNKNCPTCKRRLTRRQLRPDMNLRRKIRNLRAKCQFDSKFCDTKGLVGKDGSWWSEHELVCGYKTLKCPCCENYVCERKVMNEHLLSCPSVHVPCRFQCGTLLPRRDIGTHEKICSDQLIECKQCGSKSIPSGRLTIHMTKDCEERMITCEYSSMGCQAKFHVKDEDGREVHMQKDLSLHMRFMMEEIQTLRSKLEGKPPLPQAITSTLEKDIVVYWTLAWKPSTTIVDSGVLREAFDAQWGLEYGREEAAADDIPVSVICYESQRAVSVKFSVAVLHPATGKKILSARRDEVFEQFESSGFMFKLPDIISEGAFDRARGLTTLLVRAHIKRKSEGDGDDDDDDDENEHDDASVNEDCDDL